MKKKSLALMMAVMLLFGVVVGGTVAWLSATSLEVKNTFTVGNIEILLNEKDIDGDSDETDNVTVNDVTRDRANKYKLIPGSSYEKDPKVTVKANSEDCWVFVKIEKSANFDTFMTYTMTTTGWTALPDVDGVYYRKVTTSAVDQDFDVLDGNIVTVPNTVTKANMDTLYTDGVIDTNKLPTLTFTAYAVQYHATNIADAATAWTIANT